MSTMLRRLKLAKLCHVSQMDTYILQSTKRCMGITYIKFRLIATCEEGVYGEGYPATLAIFTIFYFLSRKLATWFSIYISGFK